MTISKEQLRQWKGLYGSLSDDKSFKITQLIKALEAAEQQVAMLTEALREAWENIYLMPGTTSDAITAPLDWDFLKWRDKVQSVLSRECEVT